MVLAAGLGTRLRPLTNDRPKALVEVGGHSLLEITLVRLHGFGIRDVIINVHHFADKVLEFLEQHNHFDMRIAISREDVLLDTGGGLKKASYFFADASDEPFILHNVDVISTIDLNQLVQFHKDKNSLATLAVQHRDSSRYLLFDKGDQLCGRRFVRDNRDEIARPADHMMPLAFSGIHVISPRLLSMMTEEGVFSIIETYLRLASENQRILAFQADDYYWRDLGKPASLEAAEQDFLRGKLAQ